MSGSYSGLIATGVALSERHATQIDLKKFEFHLSYAVFLEAA